MTTARGITLIEMLLVLGVGTLVIGGMALASTDGFDRARQRSDRDTLAALLRRARTEAMTGHGVGTRVMPHGVIVLPDRFVLFSGAAYALRDVAGDEPVPRASHTGAQGEAVFAAGSGRPSSPHAFMLEETYGVLVNEEGGIRELP